MEDSNRAEAGGCKQRAKTCCCLEVWSGCWWLHQLLLLLLLHRRENKFCDAIVMKCVTVNPLCTINQGGNQSGLKWRNWLDLSSFLCRVAQQIVIQTAPNKKLIKNQLSHDLPALTMCLASSDEKRSPPTLPLLLSINGSTGQPAPRWISSPSSPNFIYKALFKQRKCNTKCLNKKKNIKLKWKRKIKSHPSTPQEQSV